MQALAACVQISLSTTPYNPQTKNEPKNFRKQNLRNTVSKRCPDYG
jgi:hypothetical protein